MKCTTRPTTLASPFQMAERLFDQRLGTCVGPGSVSIVEDGSNTVYEFDVPGFDADSIDIDVEDGRLAVSGKRGAAAEGLVYTERRSAGFRRVLKLDRKLDPSTIEADLANGVLRISVERRPETERRKISVRS